MRAFLTRRYSNYVQPDKRQDLRSAFEQTISPKLLAVPGVRKATLEISPDGNAFQVTVGLRRVNDFVSGRHDWDMMLELNRYVQYQFREIPKVRIK